ncbi:MAG: hypothetical protein ACKVS6_10135 [Planctomycetota bacterium]
MFTRFVAFPIALILGASLIPAASTGGKAKGSIKVPVNTTGEKMSGVLNDKNGSIAFKLEATLTPTPQLTSFTSDIVGKVKGVLYKTNSPALAPSHTVVGTFKAVLLPTMSPFPVYAGKLEAKLISNSPALSPVVSAGRLSVNFIDTTISTGTFEGFWKLPQ